MMKKKLAGLITLCIFTTLAYASPASVDITNAWVQEAPPNSRVLAGFMHIKNTSVKKVTVLSAHSSDFQRVEFHRTSYHDGMARMDKQQNLIIEPGKILKLEHGGYHLMLIKPVRKLKAGDSINLTLNLKALPSVSITLDVKKPAGNAAPNEHHHHHQE